MKKQLTLHRDDGEEVTVHIIGPARLQRVKPDEAGFATCDTSAFECHGRLDVLGKYGDRLVVPTTVVDEVNRWQPAGDTNAQRKKEITDFLGTVEQVDVDRIVKSDARLESRLQTTYNLEDARAKDIAYNDFKENFRYFYDACRILIADKLWNIPDHERETRARRLNATVERIWTYDRSWLKENSRVDGKLTSIERDLIRYIFGELIPGLARKVYDAIAYANTLNGHTTTFPELAESISIKNVKYPIHFRKYWLSAYEQHLKTMFRRALYWAANDLPIESAEQKFTDRYGREAKADSHISALPLILNRGSVVHVHQRDTDIMAGLLLANWTKEKADYQ